LKVAQREKAQRGRSKQQRRAAKLHEWPRRHHHAGFCDRVQEDQRQQKGAEVARPHDLQRIHVAEQILSGGVEARKCRHRSAHQGNAGQPQAALVRGIDQ
jgi:hypothetical protein